MNHSLCHQVSTGETVELGTVQKTRLSPVAIQGLDLLVPNAAELESRLSSLCEENPFIDLERVSRDEPLDRPAHPSASGRPAGERRRGDGPDDAVAESAGEAPGKDLRRSLHFQLSLVRGIDPSTRRLCAFLIEELDPSGYLADVPAMREGALDEALAIVQSLDPAGVGARDARECLALQARRAASRDPARQGFFELCERGVETCLEDLACKRYGRAARALGVSRAQASEVGAFISTLRPRPGSSLEDRRSETAYVVPDLCIQTNGADFEITLPFQSDVALRMDRDCLALLDEARTGRRAISADDLAWLEENCRKARSVVRSFDYREHVLLKFGLFLARSQREFFLHGDRAMKPLTQAQAAEALGLSTSTISRIVQNKHVQTPWGTRPMKHFFPSRSSSDREGSLAEASSVAVKSLIAQIIDEEDARRPLSDEAIAQQLLKRGVDAKRRTVTKYRTSMRLPNASERRKRSA